jgi:hypothetical protein
MIVLNLAAFAPGAFRMQDKQIRLQPEAAGA